MEKHCNLCGAEMLLDKVFPGKVNKVKKRERYKCTDPSCCHEETIQPSNEEAAVYKDITYREQFKKEKDLARQFND